MIFLLQNTIQLFPMILTNILQEYFDTPRQTSTLYAMPGQDGS